MHYRLLDSDVVVESADPRRAIVAFGETVYEAAVETAGWPADVIGSRCDGWRMRTTPPAAVRGRDQWTDGRRRPDPRLHSWTSPAKWCSELVRCSGPNGGNWMYSRMCCGTADQS